MSKTSVAAQPLSIGARASTLALALVVGLEVAGVYGLSVGPATSEAVAAADGATVYAPVRRKVPHVEINIVAQADIPATR